MRRRQILQTALAAGGALLLSGEAHSQDASTTYVDPEGGLDTNSGDKASPLKTIAAAARRVNASKGSGARTIILSEGVYAITEPALFKPAGQPFTRDARLTICAAVLPDDPNWSPRNMPVLIHTMPLSLNWMGRPDPFGGVAYGMQFETSHVTIQGLKILGSPYLEQPTPQSIRRVYPIAREGAELDDLEIRQCLFVGNRDVCELHCAILARGNGIVIDNCVFHGCKITAVFWTGQAKGCAMRNTLAVDNYVTAAWLCGIGDDFDFRDNVLSANLSAVLFQGPVGKYKLMNSLFAGNKHLFGSGFGPPVNFKPLEASVLDLPPSSKVEDKQVEIELNQSKRDYLHVVAGTRGSEIPAGLFTRR